MTTAKRHGGADRGGLAGTVPFVFRLYVTDSGPNSSRAVVNARRFCEEHLADRYDLEIIDIRKNPGAAQEGQVVAAPTLVKLLPLPVRRFIGDLSQPQRLLAGLSLPSSVTE